MVKVPAPMETLPAFPGPNVLVPISPLLAMDNVPALTTTLPAFPVLPGSAPDEMPVKTLPDLPSIVS
jgi:streptogramin lyase